MKQNENRPAHEIRLGAIRATIWLNWSNTGRPQLRLTPSRAYKDGDGAWNDSRSYPDYDVPTLISVLQLAQNWMMNQSDSVIHEAGSTDVMEVKPVVTRRKKGGAK